MLKFIDAAKAVWRGKSIALKYTFRKEEKSQINNTSSYFKNLEKQKSKINSKNAEGQ